MADISAIPQNQLLGRLAGFLRFLEKDRPEFLPSQLGAMQAASKLMLPQASTVENLSYGNLPFTMPPSGTGAMIPQVKTGRKAEVADLVGMITGGVPGAKTVADVGTNLSNKAADELVRMITRNPQATAPAVLQEAGQMAPLSRIGLLDQLLYRAEQTSYKNPDQGAIFYSPNKAYTDLYMSEDRVLRTAKMPSDLLDIRKPKDKKMLEGWAKNKLGELEENFGRSTEVRDGYKMLQSGDISGAMANISLLVGKQNNQGIVPGLAEKLALTDLGRDAMTVREAGTEAADNFSVAFRNSEIARKYFKDLLE